MTELQGDSVKFQRFGTVALKVTSHPSPVSLSISVVLILACLLLPMT